MTDHGPTITYGRHDHPLPPAADQDDTPRRDPLRILATTLHLVADLITTLVDATDGRPYRNRSVRADLDHALDSLVMAILADRPSRPVVASKPATTTHEKGNSHK